VSTRSLGGAVLGMTPIMLGALSLGMLGRTYAPARHPLVWIACGAGMGSVIGGVAGS
jgi:hypothetical protein